MKLFLVIGTGLCLATGFANADTTTEVDSDNASEFSSAITFGMMEERIGIEDSGGWYFVPQFGLSIIGDVTYATGVYAVDTPTDFSFDNAIFYGIGIGVEIRDGFRLQFDVTTQKNDINLDTALFWLDTGGAIGVEGDRTQTPLTVSLIWEGDGDPLKPHLGATIGSTYYDQSITLTDDGVFRETRWEYGWNMTYGFLAGVSMNLSPSSDLYFNYRYLHVDYDDEPLDIHNIGISIQFRF
jgi:opacity protein-like surface antigen